MQESITDVNNEIIEKYIKNVFKRDFKYKGISSTVISIIPIDSEKKRAFLVKIKDRSIFMKINLPFWDEENTKIKMHNERMALEILNNAKIKNVPRVYKYESNSSVFGTDVLLMNYIYDTRKSLDKDSIYRLVRIIKKIHSIRSKSFTVPFGGDFSSSYKGNGHDFIRFYLEVLGKDIVNIEKMHFLKKTHLEDFLNSAFFFISKKIKQNIELFKKTKEFSMIHGHLARNSERKHILIDRKNNMYIIDWENVCFGEKELEVASFLYENGMMNSYLKKNFIDLYRDNNSLDIKKIFIYIYLIQLDDLIEELKKKLILRSRDNSLDVDFFLSIHRQRRILYKLSKKL